ncbi:Os04g0175000 [Oryza sativa Japonica Group]|uniref:Os04g0175000 protein n=2 Tax=Oryza sativa subsp. japonica TaxID=39947 RepID=Q0JF16_ORYSJ|nr:Os04g0175000 [Oryza sativa Japonica Group]BAS87929.1 Os04g0175000 [Oryza sativa Japonica Group]|eukprot:NP_001052157.1 Os04g0175000 [Oryza sativa Japonica Group]
MVKVGGGGGAPGAASQAAARLPARQGKQWPGPSGALPAFLVPPSPSSRPVALVMPPMADAEEGLMRRQAAPSTTATATSGTTAVDGDDWRQRLATSTMMVALRRGFKMHGACVGGSVEVVAACAIVEKSRRRWGGGGGICVGLMVGQ